MGNRVLIVDDDAAIRGLVSAVLRRHAYETDEACDSEEAIEKLAAGMTYDALFLDLMMPRRNGYEVLEYLQGREQRKCVIVMTAAGARGTKPLDETFVHAVLHKPFNIEDLVKAAAACVGSGITTVP